jgi:hypothetical protein
MRAFAAVLLVTVSLAGLPGRARGDADLWPLLELSAESTTVLYPLYVREGEFLMIFPLYYRTHEGRDHHVLWPTVKYSEGRVRRLAPLWFQGENTFTLFPIIHRTPTYTLWSMPPAYLRRDGTFRAVFPLYARSEHSFLMFPSYYRRRAPNEPSADTLWPLFSRVGGGHPASLDQWAWNKPDGKWWTTVNLIGRDKGPDHSVTWFMPLFITAAEKTPWNRFMVLPFLLGRHRWPDGYDRWLFPLAFARRKGDERSLFLAPYYQKKGPDHSIRALVPLFFSLRQPDRRILYLALYYHERAPDYSETWVFPLFGHSHGTRNARGGPGATRSYYSVLWPLYSREEHRSPEGALLERYRRFLVFSDHLDPAGKRTFKMLGIPIMERL